MNVALLLWLIGWGLTVGIVRPDSLWWKLCFFLTWPVELGEWIGNNFSKGDVG